MLDSYLSKMEMDSFRHSHLWKFVMAFLFAQTPIRVPSQGLTFYTIFSLLLYLFARACSCLNNKYRLINPSFSYQSRAFFLTYDFLLLSFFRFLFQGFRVRDSSELWLKGSLLGWLEHDPKRTYLPFLPSFPYFEFRKLFDFNLVAVSVPSLAPLRFHFPSTYLGLVLLSYDMLLFLNSLFQSRRMSKL